eukprot:gene13711-16220_t
MVTYRGDAEEDNGLRREEHFVVSPDIRQDHAHVFGCLETIFGHKGEAKLLKGIDHLLVASDGAPGQMKNRHCDPAGGFLTRAVVTEQKRLQWDWNADEELSDGRIPVPDADSMCSFLNTSDFLT